MVVGFVNSGMMNVRQAIGVILGAILGTSITGYERISDHCSNIAVDIIETGQDGVEAHEYHLNNDYRNDESFRKTFSEYKAKYSI